MTLWILFCRMTKDADILFAFYAKNQDDAELQAREIVKEQRYEWIDLKAFPYGFVMHRSCIPGVIEEDRA